MDIKSKEKILDNLFYAFSNDNRRKIIKLISLQPWAINKLASILKMSLPAIFKHIKVLEKAEIIQRKKIGRTTFISINRESLKQAQKWLQQYHTY